MMFYPLEMELAYKARGREGRGRTINLSNTRVLFETDQSLAIGLPIELSIAWPTVLNDGLELCLLIRGSIAEAESQRITVDITRYLFRTRSIAPKGVPEVATR